MAGVRIKISTEDARTAVKKLQADLEKLGLSSMQAAEKTKQLQTTLLDKMALSGGDAIVKRVAESTGKTKMEIEKMLGVTYTAREKLNQFADSIKNHWMAITGVMFAAYMGFQKVKEYMELGAKAQQITSSFRIMAEAAGKSSEDIVHAMKAATKETIDNSDLMLKATKLMVMGYDSEQIIRFSKNVIAASQIAGVSVGEAYEGLADAIATKMPRALLKMGAITKDQMKLVSAAVASGIDEMGLYNLAMANLELRTVQLKGTQDLAALSLQKFSAQVKETKEQLGMLVIEGLQKVYGLFQQISSMSMMATTALFRFLQGKALLNKMIDARPDAKKYWQEEADIYAAYARADYEMADKLSR